MYKYIKYLPKNYEASKEYPLLIFLHGAPQRGNNIDKLKQTALPYELENNMLKLSMIVIAPQCPENESWNSFLLYDLLIEIFKNHQINRKRIYLTGFSMGGFGTLKFAKDYPKLFAAIAPVCSGGSIYIAEKIHHIPAWFFHGKKDKIIPIEKTQEVIDQLKKFNADLKFTIYPDLAHNVWTKTYKNVALYEWFLSHHL